MLITKKVEDVVVGDILTFSDTVNFISVKVTGIKVVDNTYKFECVFGVMSLKAGTTATVNVAAIRKNV
jgi:hypothetical protein